MAKNILCKLGVHKFKIFEGRQLGDSEKYFICDRCGTTYESFHTVHEPFMGGNMTTTVKTNKKDLSVETISNLKDTGKYHIFPHLLPIYHFGL